MKPKTPSEVFTPYFNHQPATDGRELLDAASFIEGGGSLKGALELLSPQSRTTLFHVEKRPPIALLSSLTPSQQVRLLRDLGSDFEQVAA